jgi:hypothetical protein
LGYEVQGKFPCCFNCKHLDTAEDILLCIKTREEVHCLGLCKYWEED